MKIAKNDILGVFGEKSILGKKEQCFPYEVHPKMEIYDRSLGKKMKLDKYIKEVRPETQSIWKYTSFPPGHVPKVLVKDDPDKSYGFASTPEQKKEIEASVDLARQLKGATLLWVMKFTKLSKGVEVNRLDPNGLVLLANASFVVPPDADIVLE